MPTMMESGAAWLGGQLKSAAGRTVSIVRGGAEHTGLTSWKSSHLLEIVDSEGFTTQVESWDWGFVASELPSGFVFRNGDWIVETVAGVEQKFEALQIGARPCVEPADASGIVLKVHTKRVA